MNRETMLKKSREFNYRAFTIILWAITGWVMSTATELFAGLIVGAAMVSMLWLYISWDRDYIKYLKKKWIDEYKKKRGIK